MTARSEIEKLIAGFGVSKPVFVISQQDDERVSFSVKDKYCPSRSDEDTSLEQIAKMHFQEVFDHREKRFVQNTDGLAIYRAVLAKIRTFYFDNSGLKSPKQSKLYRWMSGLGSVRDYDNKIGLGILLLHKYISDNRLFSSGKDGAYVVNVLAILEMMRASDENKQ